MTEEFIKYHNDGTIWAKGQTLNGQMDGYWEYFRKDGSKMRSGYFTAGKQSGTCAPRCHFPTAGTRDIP